MSKFVDILKNTPISSNPTINKCLTANFKNIMLYGPENSGKYIQALRIIEKESPTSLAYDKKFIVSYDNDEYAYRISDIHIEINFEFLGCIAKSLWIEIYKQIMLSVKNKPFIILCTNFCSINNDLLEVFYTYMNNQNKNIRFIFLTKNISMFPNELVEQCLVFSLKQVPVSKQKPLIIRHNFVEKICEIIKAHKTIQIKALRDVLYDCLTYQCDINEIMYEVVKKSIQFVEPPEEKKIKLLNEFNINLKLFNNNYRSIYHLEKNIFSIINSLYL